MNDVFRIPDIQRVQGIVLAALAESDDDIAVQIAGVQSAGELLQKALGVATQAAMLKQFMTPKP